MCENNDEHILQSTYKFYGDEGPILVLIGGFQQKLEVWNCIVPHLAQTHRVIVFNSPGCAKDSPIIQGPPYVTLDEHAAIVKALVEKRISVSNLLTTAS